MKRIRLRKQMKNVPGMEKSENSMKNVLKKTGRTIVSLLPAAAFMGIQGVCSIAASVVLSVMTMLQPAAAGMSAEALTALATERIMDNIMLILVISQLISVVVFGLWYYFAYGRRKRPESVGKPEGKHFLMILLIGLTAQFCVSAVLSVVETLAPALMESYVELMELSGLTETTWLSICSTVLLAPVCEELVCRGLVFRLAGKVSQSFWVANIIQALAFGILHGNLIQGSYAFALGLVIGLLYRRFQDIRLCMLLHAVMNASSFLVGLYYSPVPETLLLPAYVLTAPVAAVLFVLCYRKLMETPQHKD